MVQTVNYQADTSLPTYIQDSARSALRSIGGDAAILFGSRARNDWRAHSDWDIAIITSGRPDSQPDDVQVNGHAINFAVVSDAALRERACYLGTLHRAIVRDGILIAGDYDLKELNKGALQMDIDLFRRHVINARKRIESAAEAFARLAAGTHDKDDELADCAQFVSDSADGAERLAKAVLMKLGIDPQQTHNMRALSEQARDAGHEKEAALLALLNGYTKADHVAHYEVQGELMDSCRRAGGRYAHLITLYAEIMDSLHKTPIDTSTQQEAARETLERVHGCFESQFIDMNDRLPEVLTVLEQRNQIYTHVKRAREKIDNMHNRE